MNSLPPVKTQVGEGTEFAATIYLTPNYDICGEGYEGYDCIIVFDRPALQSSLWNFDDIGRDTATATEAAHSLYELIVAFVKAARE